MNRSPPWVLAASVFAACSPLAPSTGPLATEAPASPVSATHVPSATHPGPTSAALDCDPAQVMPFGPAVLLSVQDGDHVDEWLGLNGTSILEGELHERGPWPQPSQRQILAVEPGEQLLLHAGLSDEPGDVPLRDLCLDRVAIDLAAFSPLATTPDRSNLVPLVSSQVHAGNLAFTAPDQPGDWIIRVTIDFDTDPGPSRQETFFRLLVDAPFPAVGGRTRVAPSCGTPGKRWPDLLLVQPGIEP